jgi:hypothetical protein
MTLDQLAALVIFGPFLTAALVLGIALHIKGN